MVFYNQLPTELWFIIYQMEHSSFLSSVNAEIKILANEVNRVNTRMFINMPLEERDDAPNDVAWNINEWLSFKNMTGIRVDTTGQRIVESGAMYPCMAEKSLFGPPSR